MYTNIINLPIYIFMILTYYHFFFLKCKPYQKLKLTKFILLFIAQLGDDIKQQKIPFLVHFIHTLKLIWLMKNNEHIYILSKNMISKCFKESKTLLLNLAIHWTAHVTYKILRIFSI